MRRPITAQGGVLHQRTPPDVAYAAYVKDRPRLDDG